MPVRHVTYIIASRDKGGAKNECKRNKNNALMKHSEMYLVYTVYFTVCILFVRKYIYIRIYIYKFRYVFELCHG